MRSLLLVLVAAAIVLANDDDPFEQRNKYRKEVIDMLGKVYQYAFKKPKTATFEFYMRDWFRGFGPEELAPMHKALKEYYGKILTEIEPSLTQENITIRADSEALSETKRRIVNYLFAEIGMTDRRNYSVFGEVGSFFSGISPANQELYSDRFTEVHATILSKIAKHETTSNVFKNGTSEKEKDGLSEEISRIFNEIASYTSGFYFEDPVFGYFSSWSESIYRYATVDQLMKLKSLLHENYGAVLQKHKEEIASFSKNWAEKQLAVYEIERIYLIVYETLFSKDKVFEKFYQELHHISYERDYPGFWKYLFQYTSLENLQEIKKRLEYVNGAILSKHKDAKKNTE